VGESQGGCALPGLQLAQVFAIPVALTEPPPVQTGDIAPSAATPAIVTVAEPGQMVLVRVPGALALATALVLGVHGAKPPGAELALSALTEYRYCAVAADALGHILHKTESRTVRREAHPRGQAHHGLPPTADSGSYPALTRDRETSPQSRHKGRRAAPRDRRRQHNSDR
jgi:hypothetical protein